MNSDVVSFRTFIQSMSIETLKVSFSKGSQRSEFRYLKAS
ncbi:hypothetical protein Runsl_1702 [Runella slithyformis DSM 19594]|uniref:Uncharacterized protein n=1 Tax=Runella slithyformis (strain ATCC 29530 / DSM 19594 / LMG 11500 / NCIMB 11436 / LSU 4) TaxID=761193 RepID=A0A7U3ZJ08_RUNSL|nr:hypothetical protein Runsl_1702 [Runella slithyformis DSM 19594]